MLKKFVSCILFSVLLFALPIARASEFTHLLYAQQNTEIANAWATLANAMGQSQTEFMLQTEQTLHSHFAKLHVQEECLELLDALGKPIENGNFTKNSSATEMWQETVLRWDIYTNNIDNAPISVIKLYRFEEPYILLQYTMLDESQKEQVFAALFVKNTENQPQLSAALLQGEHFAHFLQYVQSLQNNTAVSPEQPTTAD